MYLSQKQLIIVLALTIAVVFLYLMLLGVNNILNRYARGAAIRFGFYSTLAVFMWNGFSSLGVKAADLDASVAMREIIEAFVYMIQESLIDIYHTILRYLLIFLLTTFTTLTIIISMFLARNRAFLM